MNQDYDVLVQVQESILDISEDGLLVTQELISSSGCLNSNANVHDFLSILFGAVISRPKKIPLYAKLCKNIAAECNINRNKLLSEFPNSISSFYSECFSWKIISNEHVMPMFRDINGRVKLPNCYPENSIEWKVLEDDPSLIDTETDRINEKIRPNAHDHVPRGTSTWILSHATAVLRFTWFCESVQVADGQRS